MNRRREAIAQRQLMVRLEQAEGRVWRAEIARAMRDGAEDYERTGEIATAIMKHMDRSLSLLDRLIVTASNTFGRRLMSKLIKAGDDPFATAVRLYVNTVGAAKVRLIAGTTQDDLQRGIQAGLENGLGPRDIAKAITATVPSYSRQRALVIARTEVHAASQWSQVEAVRESGLDLRKEWVTVEDERTRSFDDGAEFDHVSMNGETVGLEELFAVPGRDRIDYIAYPGDPSGAPGNIINCRCVQVFVP